MVVGTPAVLPISQLGKNLAFKQNTSQSDGPNPSENAVDGLLGSGSVSN